MLSGNLNICVINKYTNILCDDNNIQQQYSKLMHPLVIPTRLKSIHNLQAQRQYEYCPQKRKPLHPMATSAISVHTPSGNSNTELVNTYKSIHPVTLLEQLLLRWQLIQAETIDTISIIVFTKIQTTCQNLSFKLA